MLTGNNDAINNNNTEQLNNEINNSSSGTDGLSQNDDGKVSPDNDTSGVNLEHIAETHTDDYNGFNPNIHATNPDGTPRRKASGEYALKRGRGAKSAAVASARGNAAVKNVAGELETACQINVDEAARQSANMVINLCVWTLGEEIGVPRDKAESEGLKVSFKNYYESRGVPDIPPELGLFLALGSYIGPRVIHEKSKPRLQRIRERIALFLGGIIK